MPIYCRPVSKHSHVHVRSVQSSRTKLPWQSSIPIKSNPQPASRFQQCVWGWEAIGASTDSSCWYEFPYTLIYLHVGASKHAAKDLSSKTIYLFQISPTIDKPLTESLSAVPWLVPVILKLKRGTVLEMLKRPTLKSVILSKSSEQQLNLAPLKASNTSEGLLERSRMPEQPSKCLWETREEIERTSRLQEKWQLSTYPKWKMQPEMFKCFELSAGFGDTHHKADWQFKVEPSRWCCVDFNVLLQEQKLLHAALCPSPPEASLRPRDGAAEPSERRAELHQQKMSTAKRKGLAAASAAQSSSPHGQECDCQQKSEDMQLEVMPCSQRYDGCRH
ncbi:hypothetical protein Anapl_17328 [Anas platyrhynchos]|uniref:Uncharacterized protein n=1 Tax=Anas platyrhynchos TaxID=8839 RepID=R0LWY5_ANAPL|nr:hypothetical protein Anapl_17328 [Anas platyrhynchos]